MNIMPVSVAECTSEIGIRMAIGARQPDIRNQFLLEARMLSVISGIIGIVVGLLGGFALTQGLGFLFVFSVVALSLHSAFLPLLVSALASIQQYVRQNLSMLIGFLPGLMITRATGLPFVITAISLLLPFIICSIIGVVFRLYPAIRASSLDPIVALRTE